MISIRLEDPDGGAAPRALARPVPHAARPARRRRTVGAPQLLPLRAARRRATTGSPSSASPTAPPAAICTPGSPSATSSTIAAPRGTFILDRTDAPVLLISAGIGATPVLAMLHALAEEHSDREIWWLHGARSSRDHSFAAEARALLASLPNVRTHVCYSRPARTTSKAATSTAPAVSPRRCSPSSSHRATPRHTSAGRRRSWTRSAPAWPRSASTPRASTPSRSGPHPA